MKQNTGNMKYKVKCLEDDKVYTISELSDLLNIEERTLRYKLRVKQKIYGKTYTKVGLK